MGHNDTEFSPGRFDSLVSSPALLGSIVVLLCTLSAAHLLSRLPRAGADQPPSDALIDSLQTQTISDFYLGKRDDALLHDSLQIRAGRRLFEETGDSLYLSVTRAASLRFRVIRFGERSGPDSPADRAVIVDSLRVVRSVFERSGFVRQVVITDILRGEFFLHITRPDYPRVFECFTEALKTARRHGYTAWESNALMGLGKLFLRLGRHDISRQYFDLALEEAGLSGSDVAKVRALKGAAKLDLLTGRPDQALRKLHELKSDDDSQPGEKFVTFYIGKAEWALGNLEAALEEFRSIEHWAEERGLVPAKLKTLLWIGRILEELGRSDEAKQYYERVLAVDAETCVSPAQWEALLELGLVAEKGNDPGNAVRHYLDAISCIESLRDHIPFDELRLHFLSDKMAPFEHLIGILGTLRGEGEHGVLDRIALEYSERARMQSFLTGVRENRAARENDDTDQLRAREKQLLRDLSGLWGKSLGGEMPPAERNDLLERMESMERELLEVKLAQELERRDQSDSLHRVDASAAEKPGFAPVGTNVCVVEYFVGKDATYAFVVRNGDVVMRELPRMDGEYSPVRLYVDLLSQGDGRAIATIGRRLSRDLLGPISSDLDGAEALVIIPDGILHYLPFETLPHPRGAADTENPGLLVERFDVSYAPSLSMLLDLEKTRGDVTEDHGSVLAVGDPVYGDRQGFVAAVLEVISGSGREERSGNVPVYPSNLFSRIASSADEVRTVVSLFPHGATKSLTGEEATEEAVKKELPGDYGIIHFATHAIYSDASPMLSGLLLTNSGGEEDGFLMVEEITAFDLAASMVVLSGCETGLGKYVRGEGLIGLSRAFFQAGARSTIVSLWRVGDRATRDFMEEFYRLLAGGMEKNAALSEAKRRSRDRGIPVSDWASFVLVGEYR